MDRVGVLQALELLFSKFNKVQDGKLQQIIASLITKKWSSKTGITVPGPWTKRHFGS
jgi:hypothetical protein